jgi:hypothetical protein
MKAVPSLPRRIADIAVPQDDISEATWRWAHRSLPDYLLTHAIRAYFWGATIAVATWPLLERLQAGLGGRRGPAVAVMTILMLLAFFAPLLVLVTSLLDHSGDGGELGRRLARTGTPPAPAWVRACRSSAPGWAQVGEPGGDERRRTGGGRRPGPQASSWLLAKAADCSC